MSEIRREGIVHVHTRLSRDANMALPELKHHCVSAGLSFACITDHAEDLKQSNVRDLVEECRCVSDDGFRAVPGLEMTLDARTHLLAIGLKKVPDDLRSPALSSELKASGALMVLAHPRLNKGVYDRKVLDLADGVEVWNAVHDGGFFPDPRVLRACRTMSRSRRLVGIGGDDLHNRSQRVRVRTVLRGSLSTENIVQSLRTGNFSIRGRMWRLSSTSTVHAGTVSILRITYGAYASARRVRNTICRGLSLENQA